MRSNRVDIVSVSKKLGHADPNVTAKYYLHSYEEGEQETADILGDMLLDSGVKVAKFVFPLDPLQTENDETVAAQGV